MKIRHTATTLEKNTIRAFLDTLLTENDFSSFAALGKKVASAMVNLIYLFPNALKVEYLNVYTAYGLSYAAHLALDSNTQTVADYIAFVAREKRANESDITDYGAFGDLFELLVRLAFVRNINLVRASALHVKEQGKTDLISRKYGKIEIGHNGKTLTSATLFDYMAGDYNAIVYGVFDVYTKARIYDACAIGEIEKAIKAVKAYTCYWSDKYTFQYDMDNLTRGGGIAVKGNDVQVVFNDGKYNAFIAAIENGKFTTLADILP